MDWDALFAEAEKRIAEVVDAFPDPLRAEVESVPCILERWPDPSLEPDTLGYYPAFEEGQVSADNGPIFLYLGAIQASCDVTGEDFAEEVERTFLHELGHHLGMDEDELRQRNLD